jgi:hypothetical protein
MNQDPFDLLARATEEAVAFMLTLLVIGVAVAIVGVLLLSLVSIGGAVWAAMVGG